VEQYQQQRSIVTGGVKMYEKRRFENVNKIKSYLPGSQLMPAA